MKSYDYEACIYDGAVCCNECLPEGITARRYPIFADSEWDGYPVCDCCGAVHNYVNLTEDGYGVECGRNNIEVFYVPASEFLNPDEGSWQSDIMANLEQDVGYTEDDRRQDAESQAGWYWWCCFPGCLPEGDANGPFSTELEAQQDAVNS